MISETLNGADERLHKVMVGDVMLLHELEAGKQNDEC